MNNHISDKAAPLSTRTLRIVGREQEIDRLKTCMQARGERHYIYYWAQGGLGKTRLLEEVQYMVKDAGPGYHTCGIIDLYHTDTHSTSDVERAIVEGLDPSHKYFAEYRKGREQYELLRERGTDPGVLERHREALSQIFVKGCHEMALDARKLVICIDTVEFLQYESSIVEAKVGLDTSNTRIRPWLLDKLGKLKNVLVVFAGRPKTRSLDETIDHQARMVADFALAFGKDLTVVELQPFTLEESWIFTRTLSEGQEIIAKQDLPVIYRLTQGMPIWLHLIIDLVRVLSPEPRAIIALFQNYRNLADVADDDRRLDEARWQIKKEILRGVFNEAAELGGYLSQVALMPKGCDQEILTLTLGLPPDEAQAFLTRVAPLSFVKHYKSLGGAERVHHERTFLHDEMYQLLTLDVVPNLRMRERQVAQSLIANYYDPRVAQLEGQISLLTPQERIPLRERLQKLLVERLYYMLVRDPRQGYAEYKRLSDQANRHRWVGYGMRLLDEFLRFYNKPERRRQSQARGILHDQIVRESAVMWVQRFRWWGQYERVIRLADTIISQPSDYFIRPDEDFADLANVYSSWVQATAIRQGYDAQVVDKAVQMLSQLPPLTECTPAQTLARARLCNAIGYQYRLGGMLSEAAEYYASAKAAFRALNDNEDELAIVLNNLSFTYARQGRITLALPLAHEALQINEKMGYEYSTGLTLSTIAAIERLRSNYPESISYGEDALSIFRQLGDVHGIALACHTIAYSKRKMSKRDMERGRKYDEAHHRLEEAQNLLDNALNEVMEAGFEADLPSLHAEQGKVYRELGRLTIAQESIDRGVAYFHQSEYHLREALKTPQGIVETADVLQDLAEEMFLAGDYIESEKFLKETENLFETKYHFAFGAQALPQGLPPECFWPLGKVERLRGEMAFRRNKQTEGLQHYMLAYFYFHQFSPDAVEKDAMVESIYNYVRRLPVQSQCELIELAREYGSKYAAQVDISPFVQALKDLLGI